MKFEQRYCNITTFNYLNERIIVDEDVCIGVCCHCREPLNKKDVSECGEVHCPKCNTKKHPFIGYINVYKVKPEMVGE
jgi:hypothetical protein